MEIGLIGISGGVGNLAKAAYKLRSAPALWNSPKVLAGGFAVHSVMMGGSLGTLHIAKAAVTEDIQSLSARKIGKIYLKDMLMVPVTHLFGATGKLVRPESALAQHGMGLAGMSTSTQLYLTLMPEDAPIGGITESIAADIVGYGTFTVGGKVAHRLSEGVKLTVPRRISKSGEVKFTPEIKEINGVRFARIPAGKFKMGAEDMEDAKPVCEVELSEFHMMENLVTNEQFKAYEEANRTKPFGLIGVKNGRTEVFDRYSEGQAENSAFFSVETAEKGELVSKDIAFMLMVVHADPKELEQNPKLDMQFRVVRLVPKDRNLDENFNDPQQPAVMVTWYEALGYAAWLDQQMREQGIPMRVRLPTEAEWEKAARGPEGFEYGTKDGKLTEKLAHFNADRPARVGSKPANGYGCHDMAGNAWQWVGDWYQDSYQGLPDKDPLGSASGTYKVRRGGSWLNNDPGLLRAAFRLSGEPDVCYNDFGFRCVAFPQD